MPGGIRRYVLPDTGGSSFEHEQAKAELKTLMPEDAKEAKGHGVRGKRLKIGRCEF